MQAHICRRASSFSCHVAISPCRFRLWLVYCVLPLTWHSISGYHLIATGMTDCNTSVLKNPDHSAPSLNLNTVLFPESPTFFTNSTKYHSNNDHVLHAWLREFGLSQIDVFIGGPAYLFQQQQMFCTSAEFSRPRAWQHYSNLWILHLNEPCYIARHRYSNWRMHTLNE